MNIISKVRRKFRNKIIKPRVLKKLKNDILEYYGKQPVQSKDEKIVQALSFIQQHGVYPYPYSYIDKYNIGTTEVRMDQSCGLRYVIHNNYRLYFPRGMNEQAIRFQYEFFSSEQDTESPHCYQSESFVFEDGDVLLDVGAAEGIFSLSMIDKASKVYLFEAEKEWMEPLTKTFEPWKDKVEIINKYVSNIDSDKTITIDTFANKMKGKSVFLKLDVEGAEKLVIEGAKNMIESGDNVVKAAICTYHNQNDHADLSRIMTDKGYRVETSTGYMLFINDRLELDTPYFRRGIIYCQK